MWKSLSKLNRARTTQIEILLVQRALGPLFQGFIEDKKQLTIFQTQRFGWWLSGIEIEIDVRLDLHEGVGPRQNIPSIPSPPRNRQRPSQPPCQCQIAASHRATGDQACHSSFTSNILCHSFCKTRSTSRGMQ